MSLSVDNYLNLEHLNFLTILNLQLDYKNSGKPNDVNIMGLNY